MTCRTTGAARRFAALSPSADRAAPNTSWLARYAAGSCGILAARDPAPGVWARVAGDALDLALLGAAVKGSRRRSGVAVAAALVAGVAAADVWCARRLGAPAAA